MLDKKLLVAAAVLAIASGTAAPALAQGGTGSGGGGTGGGTGGGGSTTTTTLATPAIAPGTFDGIGPGPVYIHDSIGHAQGTRYKQDGSIIDVGLHPEANGVRAEYGNNKTETWVGPATGPRWQFATVGPSDPFEPYTALQDAPAPLGYSDGELIIVSEPGAPDTRPNALLPFPAPTGSASTVSADVVAFYGKSAIGFSSSNATNQNFETNGQAWLELDTTNSADPRWAFHTNGLSGTTLTGTFTLDPSSFNRAAVSYDPVNHVAAASINGNVVASVSYATQSIKYVGVEGSFNGNVDNFSVYSGSVTDPMPSAIAAPATPATTKF